MLCALAYYAIIYFYLLCCAAVFLKLTYYAQNYACHQYNYLISDIKLKLSVFQKKSTILLEY